MYELDGLIRRARLDEDDDLPRLVLADWLEENGDAEDRARAEFLRLQVRLARTPGPSLGRDDLEWRQRQLWWDHVEHWLGPLYEASAGFEYRRGFASVELNGGTDRDWEALFRLEAWRWVDELRFTNPSTGVVEALLRSPALGWLSQLAVEGRPVREEFGEVVPEDLLDFSGSAEADLLVGLRLSGCGLTDEDVPKLASLPLPNLRTLDLTRNLLNDGLEALASFSSLVDIDLGSNDLSRFSGLRRMLSGPLGPRLSRLGLSRTRRPAGARYWLAFAGEFPNLRELDLEGNHLDDSDIVPLAGSPLLRGVHRLWLGENDFDEDGIAALTASPMLDQLEELGLEGTSLSRQALNRLAAAPRWPNLRRLILGGMWIDSARTRGLLYQRFGGMLDM